MKIKKAIQILIILANASIAVAQQSNGNLTISPEGVGDIKIYKTTLSDLKEKYPECKIERYRESLEFGFSIAGRAVSPENLGIHFFLERKKWFGPFYVRVISIDSTFKGKTATGVGIGSTYSEITAEFGENKIIRLQSSDHEISRLYYDKSPASITFNCNNIKANINSFKVDWIYINGWDESW